MWPTSRVEELKAFVEKGGEIVTHETSLYDERGRRRNDFRLACLFQASFAGNVIDRQQNAYRIDSPRISVLGTVRYRRSTAQYEEPRGGRND
jgi:hypothetical protein